MIMIFQNDQRYFFKTVEFTGEKKSWSWFLKNQKKIMIMIFQNHDHDFFCPKNAPTLPQIWSWLKIMIMISFFFIFQFEKNMIMIFLPPKFTLYTPLFRAKKYEKSWSWFFFFKKKKSWSWFFKKHDHVFFLE